MSIAALMPLSRLERDEEDGDDGGMLEGMLGNEETERLNEGVNEGNALQGEKERVNHDNASE